MLLLDSSVCGLFKWRQFEPEVILLAVGWYLRFSLSYRDVEELLAERGLHADHVTVWRWVQRYAPEMERRLRSRLKPTTGSWRVGGWTKPTSGSKASGATCIVRWILPERPSTFSSRLSRTRPRAKRFLVKALGGANHPAPRVINTDGHAAYPPAVARAQSRRRSRRGLPASAGAIFEQRARAGPPRDSRVGSTPVSISAPSGELGAQSPAMKRYI
jgi:transposase-like protein